MNFVEIFLVVVVVLFGVVVVGWISDVIVLGGWIWFGVCVVYLLFYWVGVLVLCMLIFFVSMVGLFMVFWLLLMF